MELLERTQIALDEAWNVLPDPFPYPEKRMRRLFEVMGLALSTAVQQKLVSCRLLQDALLVIIHAQNTPECRVELNYLQPIFPKSEMRSVQQPQLHPNGSRFATR